MFARSLDPARYRIVRASLRGRRLGRRIGRQARSTVPIMLDESIYTMADVEKAAALGAADIIKLKLMKLGGIDKLERALTRSAR